MPMALHALHVVGILLEEVPEVLGEATVRLPPRGHRWIAVYTSDQPGVQVARSTGFTDRMAALELARKWEAEARQRRRAMLQRIAGGKIEPGGHSQEQVARILNLSPRTVRAIEKRALRKLRRHADLQRLWREFGQTT